MSNNGNNVKWNRGRGIVKFCCIGCTDIDITNDNPFCIHETHRDIKNSQENVCPTVWQLI